MFHKTDTREKTTPSKSAETNSRVSFLRIFRDGLHVAVVRENVV